MFSAMGELWLKYSFWMSSLLSSLLSRLPGNLALVASVAIGAGIGEIIHISSLWISVTLVAFLFAPLMTVLVAIMVIGYAGMLIERNSRY